MQKQKVRLEYKLNNTENVLYDSNYTELEEKILSYFNTENKATITKIVEFTGANRNTIKKALQNLVNKNVLILHSKGRGAWYSVS